MKYVKIKNSISKEFKNNRNEFYSILKNQYYDKIFDYHILQIEKNYYELQECYEETLTSYRKLYNELDFNEVNINKFVDNYNNCINLINEQYSKETFELHLEKSIQDNRVLLKNPIKNMRKCIRMLEIYDLKKECFNQKQLYKKAAKDLVDISFSIRVDLTGDYFEFYEYIIDELEKSNQSILDRCRQIDEDNNEKEGEEDNITKIEYENIFKNKEFQRVLHDNGFEEKRQTGGHKIYKKGSKTIVLPIHSKEIKKGLSRAIQKTIFDEVLE